MDSPSHGQNEPLLTSQASSSPTFAALSQPPQDLSFSVTLPDSFQNTVPESYFSDIPLENSPYHSLNQNTSYSSDDKLVPLLTAEAANKTMGNRIHGLDRPARAISARHVSPEVFPYDNISEGFAAEIISSAAPACSSSTEQPVDDQQQQQQQQQQPATVASYTRNFTVFDVEEPSPHSQAPSLPAVLEPSPLSYPIPESPPLPPARKKFSISKPNFRLKRRSLTSSSSGNAPIEMASTTVLVGGHQRSQSQPQTIVSTDSDNGSEAAGVVQPGTPMSGVPTLVLSPSMDSDTALFSGDFNRSTPVQEEDNMYDISLGKAHSPRTRLWDKSNNSKQNSNQKDPEHIHDADCETAHGAEDKTLDEFKENYSYIPTSCSSKKDITVRRRSWVFIINVALSVISTSLSIIWFYMSLKQPRWGWIIMSGGKGLMSPTTASYVTALLSKVIELSFVTVMVANIGQILTTRAIAKNGSVTLSEMAVRNWVIQPGSIIAQCKTLPRAVRTTTGFIAIYAALVSMFYTTASQVMVSPKLMYGNWKARNLSGMIKASYGNPYYVADSCSSLLGRIDPNYGDSCLDVKYSGWSFRSLANFLQEWDLIHDKGGMGITTDMKDRPVPTSLLFNNITLTGSWILSDLSNVTYDFINVSDSRVVNQVNMAMPHPGVYLAAINEANGIMQPQDLSGVGEYMIHAGVVSPVVNVTCIEAMHEELEPLVWPSWLHNSSMSFIDPNINRTNLSSTWYNSVPGPSEWQNVSTPLNHLFNWGRASDNKTLAPAFSVFPDEYNMVTNNTVYGSAALYILAKPPNTSNYTLCSIQSYLSPNCSTHFNISGIGGANMRANCFDSKDETRYDIWNTDAPQNNPNADWRNMMQEWALALDLGGGKADSNTSNSRILTQLAVTRGNKEYPALSTIYPSIAEALAVLASSGLVIGSLGAQFYHYWGLELLELPGAGVPQYFNASVKSQEFTSGHEQKRYFIFYLILFGAVIINVLSLLYLVLSKGFVTDFTEPQNMFALAVNSPPSRMMNGSCGGGPSNNQMNIPFRVGFNEAANHYYLKEVNCGEKPMVEEEPKTPGYSYRKLSAKTPFPNRLSRDMLKRRSTQGEGPPMP